MTETVFIRAIYFLFTENIISFNKQQTKSPDIELNHLQLQDYNEGTGGQQEGDTVNLPQPQPHNKIYQNELFANVIFIWGRPVQS